MTKKPVFSVIIPTYNSADFIHRSIQSILSQTFKDFELIIVDDGSIDSTPDILKKFSEGDARIKVATIKNSGGPTIPTNIGLNMSSGDYFAFLDHDDQWKPEKLNILYKTFIKNPEVGFLMTNVEIHNEKEKCVKKSQAPVKNSKISVQDILSGNYFNTFSMLSIKRDVLEKAGLLDTQLSVFADYEMIVRMTSLGIPHIFLEDALVNYHVHEKNFSEIKRSALQRIKDLEKIISKHKDKYNEYKKSEVKLMNTIARLYIHLGDKKKSREYLKKSILRDCSNPITYIRFLLSYFGEKPYKIFNKIITRK